jgi:tripartite ATP-independent transporter DctM subunit
MIPEMRKYGYGDALSTGAVAAAGTLGVLIPPSLVMVVFCVMTDTPVSMLFIAGIVPGILLTLFFILGVRVYVQIRPDSAPAPVHYPLRQKIASIPNIWGVALLIGVIWGGIYGGLFTATEAGAIGTLLAFLLLIYRRSIRTAWRNIADAIPDAVQATAMIFVTMIAAMLFSKYLTVLGVFDGMLRGMSATGMPPIVTVLIIFAVIMIMGMFMVAMAVLLITAPIATAILVPLGYDPLWIGIMMILLFELANITPPIGLNTYVVKGIAPEVPMADIFKGSGIFIVMIVLLMVLLTIFPGIVTWLPNTLR